MITLLNEHLPDEEFPDIDTAETAPDGLLAVGGDLSSTRLLNAYEKGIFPWFSEGQPILWWSPNPRMVLFPGEFKRIRSLGKNIRKQKWSFSLDHAFDEVIAICSEIPRQGQDGSWITPDMQQAYKQLHQLGHAHSVEVWQSDQLVGGLYGVSVGHVFFGESMFSKVTDASKAALFFLDHELQKQDYQLIDCQVYSEHLASLGARLIERKQFKNILARNPAEAIPAGWPSGHFQFRQNRFEPLANSDD